MRRCGAGSGPNGERGPSPFWCASRPYRSSPGGWRRLATSSRPKWLPCWPSASRGPCPASPRRCWPPWLAASPEAAVGGHGGHGPWHWERRLLAACLPLQPRLPGRPDARASSAALVIPAGTHIVQSRCWRCRRAARCSWKPSRRGPRHRAPAGPPTVECDFQELSWNKADLRIVSAGPCFAGLEIPERRLYFYFWRRRCWR